MKTAVVRKHDLLYPALSYKIVGCAYDVYNQLGAGHHEKYYQRALAKALTDRGINFQEQAVYPLVYRGSVIGRQRLDYVIENCVVVEIKKGSQFSRSHIEQILEYLKISNLKLAILINFGDRGVLFRRIVNIK